MEGARAQRRKADASPDIGEWKKQFGNKVKHDEASGEFSITLTERQDIRKAYEMQEGSRKIEVERGHIEQARLKREKMVRRDNGKVMDLPEEIVESVRHKFRPTGRGGSSPAERFSMSGATRDYERGPDGLYFKWSGGWEPTNLWRNGALSPQRDPDGNLWVEVDGDWLLTDEVA